MIHDLRIKQLKPIPDDRGMVMELLRNDDDIFMQFGQSYIATVRPGVVKAWHYHKKQTDHFVCVRGQIKLAIYDDRTGSPTRGQSSTFYLGIRNPILVQIPPLLHHGFMGTSEEEAIVINFPTHPYNHKEPDEFRFAAHDPNIPYDWSVKDR